MTQPTVAEIRALLAAAAPGELPSLLDRHAGDGREGVRAALRSAAARLERERLEMTRLDALYALEARLRCAGCRIVAGIDEVGRGALAGPLTAAAVVLPPEPRIAGLDDSKRLTPERREHIAQHVRSVALGIGVSHVSPAEIDALGMTQAVKRAMIAALEMLAERPDHVLVDGRPVGVFSAETAVVKGDGKIAAIAAASVVAKVERDALMRDLAATYPEYGFALNKGYGSSDHLAAIKANGLTPMHRRSFAPCGGTLPLF